MNPKVEPFYAKSKHWHDEYAKLREIVLETGLTEEYKWMHPCYTVDGKNVLLIHGFKAYCAILFHKGVLLKDPENLLIQQTENVQAGRQLRFTNLQQIVDQAEIIKSYILEAIEIEKSGREVPMKPTTEFIMVEEFRTKLDELPALREAFEALTPGRQRGYLLYFSAPKQIATREARVEKCTDMILEGTGLHD